MFNWLSEKIWQITMLLCLKECEFITNHTNQIEKMEIFARLCYSIQASEIIPIIPIITKQEDIVYEDMKYFFIEIINNPFSFSKDVIRKHFCLLQGLKERYQNISKTLKKNRSYYSSLFMFDVDKHIKHFDDFEKAIKFLMIFICIGFIPSKKSKLLNIYQKFVLEKEIFKSAIEHTLNMQLIANIHLKADRLDQLLNDELTKNIDDIINKK